MIFCVKVIDGWELCVWMYSVKDGERKGNGGGFERGDGVFFIGV